MLALLVVGLLVGGHAQAQAPQKPSSPPPFKVLRAEEDYRYLRAPDAPRAPLDGLKYLPLTETGSVFLSLGGDLRQRHVAGAGGRVVQHRVALAERAALDVLSAHAHAGAVCDQAGEGQRLRG